MKKTLIVVDMQNDFIDGSLGTKEAQAIVGNVKKKIGEYQIRGDEIIFTRDTHQENYLDTPEGKKLPVPHCIKGTDGWQIRSELQPFCKEAPLDKVTFGSFELGARLVEANRQETVGQITFIGLCTDICVISNALLAKAFLPEAEIVVDASCCAGVTPESHKNALEAMKVCQIRVENE